MGQQAGKSTATRAAARARTQRGQLLVADEVAAVVEGAIAHEQHALGRLLEQGQHVVRDAEHAALALRPDVVRLPDHAPVQDDVERGRHVLHVQVAARRQPCAPQTLAEGRAPTTGLPAPCPFPPLSSTSTSPLTRRTICCEDSLPSNLAHSTTHSAGR